MKISRIIIFLVIINILFLLYLFFSYILNYVFDLKNQEKLPKFLKERIYFFSAGVVCYPPLSGCGYNSKIKNYYNQEISWTMQDALNRPFMYCFGKDKGCFVFK